MVETFDFGVFPLLRTERLLLRELDAIDVEDIFAFRGDPVVQRLNSKPHDDVAETLAFVEELRGLYRQKREVNWGMIVPYPSHEGAAPGKVARDYWGRGFSSEARPRR